MSEFGKASCSVRKAADGARKTELPVSDQEATGALLQVKLHVPQMLHCVVAYKYILLSHSHVNL